MFGYIYLTTDLLNGKQYVGQKKSSVFLEENYVGSGKIIKTILSSLKKNGIDVKQRFKTVLLKECFSQEELNEQEDYYIEYYNTLVPNGYNIRIGGQFLFEDGVLSELIKQAYKEHPNIGMNGKRQTEHQKETVRQYMKNRVVTKESRKKMSESHKGKTYGLRPKAQGRKFMYKDDEDKSIIVQSQQISFYESLGYKLGRKPYSKEVRQKQLQKYSNGTYIYKDTQIIFIPKKDIDMYIEQGWKIGHPKGLVTNKK